MASSARVLTRLYAPPRDRLLLTTNEPCVLELADRLWERTEETETSPEEVAKSESGAMRLDVRVEVGPRPPDEP